jgi:hypothetical protein
MTVHETLLSWLAALRIRWWWCLLFVLSETINRLLHIPIWVPPLEIEENTCDDVAIMSLMETWCFFAPFRLTLNTHLSVTLTALNTHFSVTLSAHLYKWLTLMSHSCLTTIILILLVHTSWSLPPLRPCHVSYFRQRWAYDWIYSCISLIQELPVLEPIPSPSLSMSISANNQHLISHSYLTISNWIMPVCTSQSLPPFSPCLPLHFRQGWGASVLSSSQPLI